MNLWSQHFSQNTNVKLSGFLPLQHRAEIMTIFRLYFGRNDDFINSFWKWLTFTRTWTLPQIKIKTYFWQMNAVWKQYFCYEIAMKLSQNIFRTAKLILFNDPIFIAQKWLINKKVTMYPSHDFQSQWVYSRYFQNKLVTHQLLQYQHALWGR